MKAIIVAGGRGERLRPLTDKLAKPMLEVAGKPILEHIVGFLKKNNITEIIFSLCYKPETVISYFGDGIKFGIKISYLIQKKIPQGTAGDILKAQKYIKDTFIVTYGDILRELDIAQLIKTHKKNKAFATLVVYKNKNQRPKSLVRFDRRGRVFKFLERPSMKEIKQADVWSNGSLYILEPAIFDFIPRGQKSDFAYDIFPKILTAGKKVYAFEQTGYFIDIGSKEKLEEARRTFKT